MLTKPCYYYKYMSPCFLFFSGFLQPLILRGVIAPVMFLSLYCNVPLLSVNLLPLNHLNHFYGFPPIKFCNSSHFTHLKAVNLFACLLWIFMRWIYIGSVASYFTWSCLKSSLLLLPIYSYTLPYLNNMGIGFSPWLSCYKTCATSRILNIFSI